MRLELRGHHVDITPRLRQFVEEKLSKVERLLNARAFSALAILTIEKHRRVADITLHASGERFLHGLGESASWETSLTRAVAKICQQAKKLKMQQKGKRHRLKAPAAEAPQAASRRTSAGTPSAARAGKPPVRMPRVLRASREALKPMSVEDAVREVDAAGGEGVVVFRNADSEAISVVYRRRNGELALVETEA